MIKEPTLKSFGQSTCCIKRILVIELHTNFLCNKTKKKYYLTLKTCSLLYNKKKLKEKLNQYDRVATLPGI